MATAYGYGLAKEVLPEYRTQKARGVKSLSIHGYPVPQYDLYGIEYFCKAEEVPLVDENGNVLGSQFVLPFMKRRPTELIDKFVRPCPMVPRHGFVDSRPVRNLEQAEALINETLAAEDRAELLVMPFVDAKYSAIWTPGQIVVGPSNDGATTGHGSKVIPVVGDLISTRALEDAGVTDSPYVELLWAHREHWLSTYNGKSREDMEDEEMKWECKYVQLRNGPVVPSAVDYIPEKLTVKTVVVACGDLLEWETKAKKFTPGTVVYHPGGSLASHYAVHAVLNKIAVVCSKKVKIGEVLEPNTEAATCDLKTLRAGFRYGCKVKMHYRQAVKLMLVGCHNTAVWMGKQDFLLGMAMGLGYRLTVTAALGEARHAPGRKQRASRNHVYKGVWNKVLHAATTTRYVKALDAFLNLSWPSSFGGNKWYAFSAYAGKMFNCMVDGDVKASLEVFNQLVHAAHNGGWAFDKFISNNCLDETAACPVKTLLYVIPQTYEALGVSTMKYARLAGWFDGRKHYELEAMDEVQAKLDKQAEAKASKLDGSYKAEKSDPERDCDCETCQSFKKEKKKKIRQYHRLVAVQVKPVRTPDGLSLNVQYQTEAHVKLKTYSWKVMKNVDLPSLVKMAYRVAPKCPSMYVKLGGSAFMQHEGYTVATPCQLYGKHFYVIGESGMSYVFQFKVEKP